MNNKKQRGVVHPPAFAASMRAFPNPATNTLTVSFETDQAEHTAISRQGMTGPLVNQDFAAGSHTVSMDIRKLPAAVYALNIRTAARRPAACRCFDRMQV